MKTLLFTVAGMTGIFLIMLFVTHRLWPAAAAASAFAIVLSCIISLRTIRTFPHVWMRRGATALVLLFFALIIAEWGLAEFGRSSAYRGDPRDLRILAHGTLKSLALDAAQAPKLMEYYHKVPAVRRQAFGPAARSFILQGASRNMFAQTVDRHHRLEILPSADSELVIRTTLVLPVESGGKGDSLEVQGRLILTARGGRYVIDR